MGERPRPFWRTVRSHYEFFGWGGGGGERVGSSFFGKVSQKVLREPMV